MADVTKASSLLGQRVIRVFVSSTFLDMQTEREELIKRVFPQLRKLCEDRGVTWGEVDLRWGVTEEQRAEGRVLPICLDEVRRCMIASIVFSHIELNATDGNFSK